MFALVTKILQTEEFQFNVKRRKGIYTFLNPVSYLDALENKELFEQFDGIFADGSILVAAIHALYGKKVKRYSFDMTSVAPKLFESADVNENSVYIVASQQEQVVRAVQVLRERYRKIRFVRLRNGYFKDKQEWEKEISRIVNVQPDYLIVGMGVVRQERFLLAARNAGFRGVGFTCGGFIHQTASNEIDYYPAWINRLNLRFLYRMYREPHTRMRYLKAGIVFPIKFLLERLKG
jgi:N-acetylglucosaminyldiphosphoundecaprenol N-acetyl-beta-D-mannosaminyltransferase